MSHHRLAVDQAADVYREEYSVSSHVEDFPNINGKNRLYEESCGFNLLHARFQSSLEVTNPAVFHSLPRHRMPIDRVHERKLMCGDPTPYLIDVITLGEVMIIGMRYIKKHGTALERIIWELYFEELYFYGREVTHAYIARQAGAKEDAVDKAFGRLIKKLQKLIIN